MGLIAMGVVALMGALAFCVYYLAFAPRWRVWARVLIAVVVLLAAAVFILSVLLMVRPFDYPIVAWRPFTTAALLSLPVVAYVGLGLAGVAVIDLIWRGATRARGGSPAAPVGHGDGSGVPQDDTPGRASTAVKAAPADVLPGQGDGSGVPQHDTPGRASTTGNAAPADILPTRVVFLRWAMCLVTAAALGLTVFGYVRAHEPAVTPVTVTSDELPPAFDGYRIALLSDLHIGPGLSGSFLRHLVDETNAAQPDLVVIAGDLVDGSVAELAADLSPLTDLRAPDGVIVVTGNHEVFSGMPSAWIAAFRSLGLTVLDNNGVTLHRGGTSIDVLGIGDRISTGALVPDLTLADQRLRDAAGPPSQFRILAVHEPLQVLDDGHGRYVAPDGVGLAATLGVDLALCGHTHGGQMWPAQGLIRLQQPVLDGAHDLGGVTTVTSRGAGAWGPPVRVGAPPEIPLVTLRVAT